MVGRRVWRRNKRRIITTRIVDRESFATINDGMWCISFIGSTLGWRKPLSLNSGLQLEVRFTYIDFLRGNAKADLSALDPNRPECARDAVICPDGRQLLLPAINLGYWRCKSINYKDSEIVMN